MNTPQTAASLLLLTTGCAAAQTYSSGAAPAPRPALVNEWLRDGRPAFDAWDIGAAVRLRFEDRNQFIGAATGAAAGANDFKAITANPNNSIFLQRVKPHLGHSAGWFSAFVEGRGSFTTGDDRNPNPESDGAMDFHQAFVTLGNARSQGGAGRAATGDGSQREPSPHAKEFPLSLKVGRQELIYADERLVGASDWTNPGRVFDAVKLRWQSPWFGVDAFVSRLVLVDDNNLNVANDYEHLSGLYFDSKTLAPKFDAQWYLLARSVSGGSPAATTGAPQAGGPAPRDIYTIGARFKSLPGAFGRWDFTTELMGQLGHFNDPLSANPGGTSLEHEAFAVHAAAGYTWTDTKFTPRAGLDYNFASGDSNPDDGKHGTFDNLYPTNHKSYGFMDLVSLQNIHDLRLTVSAKPLSRLALTADFHAFWLADTGDNFYTVSGFRRGGIAATPGTGYGINPGYSSHVGSEVDLTATCTLTRFATAQAGYGHFFAGDYIRQSLASPAVGSTDANWFYAQLNLTF